MKAKQKYYCIGIKRKSGIKDKELTQTSKQLRADAVTLVGDNGGVYVFTDKNLMKQHLKELKENNTDKTVFYQPLDMGTSLPNFKPSQLISK